MESNIKGLVAAGHEMASELKAECGAVDMRSVAKLISDLATQLEVQLVRANALAEDQQKAIESIKQADAAVKLAHEKFSALAAENAGLKAAFDKPQAYLSWHAKGVEDACLVVALQNQYMSAPIAPEAIEYAIEYIRSIAFHIDEDDYHGKHIAHYMQQALAWLEGHSCSADSQDKSDNSPLPRYQVIELTMLVKQLVSQLKKAKPDCKLPERAMDYLLRNGLVSVEGVLR